MLNNVTFQKKTCHCFLNNLVINLVMYTEATGEEKSKVITSREMLKEIYIPLSSTEILTVTYLFRLYGKHKLFFELLSDIS